MTWRWSGPRASWSPPPHALWSARVEGTGKLPRMEGGGCGLLLFLAASAHADQRERWWKQTEFFPDTMHCLSSGSTASEEPPGRGSGWRRDIHPTSYSLGSFLFVHSLIRHFFCSPFFLSVFPFQQLLHSRFWGVTTHHTFLLEKE